MERDFFGISGKESASSVKDDGRTARQDPAVFGGSAIQWPFSSKVSPVPSFMSFKAAQEQQPKKLVFDQFPSSGFQPISTVDAVEAANQKSSPVSAPQKAFNMDRQAMQQYLYAYQHQGNDSFGASAHQMNRAKAFPVVSHHPIPIGSPFFKLQSATDSPNITVTPLKQQIFGGGNGPAAGSVVGTFASRNMPKSSPTTAQLTIFYAGVVNVFDNVPLDKAQELMLFASKASNTTAVSASPKPAPVIPAAVKLVDSEGLNTKQTPTQKQSHAAPLNSSLSSAVSVASQGGSLSKSASSSNDDSIRPKSAGPSAPGNQNETSTTLPPALGATTAATIMTRAAVPQARKASLARFLEKRKERMTNAAPYACAKKPSENADGFENSIIMPSKSSSTDITLSSNCDESWNLAQAKNSSHSADSPSTRLEI